MKTALQCPKTGLTDPGNVKFRVYAPSPAHFPAALSGRTILVERDTILGAARKINTTVQAGGKIEVRAPDLPPGQPVEVTIRLVHEQPNGRRSVLDILAECPGGLLFKTPADVDAYIRQERQSWER